MTNKKTLGDHAGEQNERFEADLIADADELEQHATELWKDNNLTVFSCGGGCLQGGEHQWDGPTKMWETGESGTCSKCGITQIDYDMMSLP